MIRNYAIIMILWSCVVCQNTALRADSLPTPTPPPVLIQQPTQTPRPIGTEIPTSDDLCRGEACLAPTETPIVTEVVTNTPPASADEWVFGTSVGGRELTARRFGAGERVLLLVGGIHGGWETNTVTLMEQLIDHFTAAPEDIPPNTAVIIVANANPDGTVYAGIPRGRFNDNGVDLNRNWGCDWSPDAFWRQQRVSAGLQPFSEPESQALRDLILSERPAAALFYHSAANGIYAGECDGDHGSAEMSAVLGEATGYSYGADFSAYPVTGTAVDWADGQGIPAADVELASHEDSEFERNLRGIEAVLAWISEDS